MEKLRLWIENIGMKKMCLFIHYFFAIIVSMTFFVGCTVLTFIPQTVDVTVLMKLYVIIMIYCVVVIAYITILCIFEQMQTMNKRNTKFDWIAFFIGFCMFVTLGLIIVCIVYMFTHELNEITSKLWITLIAIFGSMFMVESGGGYIYKGYKNKIMAKLGLMPEQVKETKDDIKGEVNES